MFSKFDSSIVWKIILPVPVCLIAMIVGLWFAIPAFTAENVIQDAISSARGTVNQFKVIRGYYTKNVIKKAVESKGLKPHFDHKGKPGVIPLPATFIHDVSKELETADTNVKLYSAFPFPNRKDGVLDTFQTEAWAFLKDNPDDIFSRQETRDGAAIVRVAIADKMVAQGCVNCHNSHPDSPKTDWKLNDVRGVLEVATPIAAQLAAGNALSNKILMLVLIAGVALAAINFYAAHRVSRPLVSLNNVARALASGDNDVEIPNLERADEVGRLSASVQIFKDNAIKMGQMADDAKVAEKAAEEKAAADIAKRADSFENAVSSVLHSVTTASDQLNSTAKSMSTTAERSNSQTEAAASATERASTNVQTVAAASEELSSSISEISRQVSDAAAIAVEAVDAAEKTNASVLGLSEAGQKIGDVVNLINDIANQTNLLALNATIEAARAGEAGKGFAVVASEVKSLATQTAKATEDISIQITSMQDETAGAVKAIENISEVIGRINEISGTITSGIDQQSEATSEISRNAQEAAVGTEEVSGNIAGVSETSAETGEAATQVLSAAGELSKQAESLKAEVQSFLDQMRAA